MKTKIILFTIVHALTLQISSAQEVNKTEKLLGKINELQLQKKPFSDWYTKNYQNYIVDKKTIKKLRKSLKKYDIQIFMGTWCKDSKREVPRFYKILENAKFPKNKISLIAVDSTKENYKKSPTGEEKGLNIIRVPTFIFYKNGIEVNRIIEYPIESLEKDLLKIIKGETYIPNYSVH